MDHDRPHFELKADAALIGVIARELDPELALPTCPDWRPVDLVRHVGRGHLWASLMITERATRPMPIGDEEPPDRSGWGEWLHGCARRLSEAVRKAGPDATVWTWSVEQTAGFWLRRLMHDQLVHRVDAQLAAGIPPEIDPDIAADNVTDLLESITVISSGSHGDHAFLGLRGDGQTLHFHATDDGLGEAGEWSVRRTPDGVEWEHGHRKADVAVRGPATDLMIVLNRRATAAERGLQILGDETVFEHWIVNSRF